MAEQGGQEKTEQATPKRLEEARQKGNVAKSMELPSASVLLAGLLALAFTAPLIHGQLSGLFVGILGQAGEISLDLGGAAAFLTGALLSGLKIAAPVMAVVFAVAVLVNFFQVGALFTLKPLQPKLEKINPAKGIKRYFSVRTLADLIKNLAKLILVGVVAYKTVEGEMAGLAGLASMSVEQIVVYILSICFQIFLRCALLILALALADFAFQRWQYNKNLMMSKQEVKDEYKQREGDPLVKSKIRAIQRRLANERMMDAVPEADVVITNPTHLAVALSYRSGEMSAPKVVAKGADLLAERIKEKAQEHGIPLVEDKPLARALYRLEVGQVIPEELFQAVAKVLAYVYQLKDRKSAARAR